ncbi:MAG: hypothetical protein AAGG01_16585, partial [Planctomycetota bacterium]
MTVPSNAATWWLASTSLLFFSASCGSGLAGGASAAGGSGDEGGGDEVVLLTSESSPRMTTSQPVEPTTVTSSHGDFPAEPTDVIVLQFSGEIDLDLDVDDFQVAVKRPMGAFEPVAVEGVTPSGTSRR